MSAAIPEANDDDLRFMAAASRLARWHLGRTGTNPSVATLIVRDGAIVGRGITALGGRPHAEAQALREAGDLARGATAYVTLEPCAHHGRTPPCAEALVGAGIARVVAACTDPDDRVSGRGYAILSRAGIAVTPGCGTAAACHVLRDYLGRAASKRAQVTLKLAISADGMIGHADHPRMAITGAAARAQTHVQRAEADAIMIGLGTARADNPDLTCRLPGLEDRSPARIVIDTHAHLPIDARLVETAHQVPTYLATCAPQGEAAADLAARGVRIIACAPHQGRVALPELLEDLAALGFTNVLAEGGAALAKALLEDDLVAAMTLYQSDVIVGHGGIEAPVSVTSAPQGFVAGRHFRFGADRMQEFFRKDAACSPAL